MSRGTDHAHSLAVSLRGLKLPGLAAHWADVALVLRSVTRDRDLPVSLRVPWRARWSRIR